MADIAGALRSIISSIFHLSNAHDQLAAISPTGNPMGQGAVVKARQMLNDALAMLDAPNVTEQASDANAAPPAPPPPAEGEANPPAGTSEEPAADPADTSADALNAEEAAANPAGETPPAPLAS